jgi:phage terminase large subunit-like protein
VFVAWDASSRRDSTAVVFGQWQQIEGRRRLRVSTRVWERPLRLDGYDPNWRVPKGEVLQHVRDLARRYDVRSVAYDPYLIAWVVEDLEGEGLPMVEWPQTDQRMFPATQRLFELIVDGDLAHDGDPVLTRHIKAARVKGNARAGQRLVKSQTGRKIDAAIALVMLAGEASAEPPAPSGVSVYVPD